MELEQVLQCLGLDPADPVARGLCREFADAAPRPVPRDWRILSAAVARSLMPADSAGPRSAGRLWRGWNETGKPLVLGVSGSQGSGKTTLARQLQRALEAAGARTAVCSLDDFYLSRVERQVLAQSVHPLLATRGVPGTHDVALLGRTMTALGEPGTVSIPAFDKAADDPLPAAHWHHVQAPVDVLVLEGWCLGARAQADSALDHPVNDLEAHEDAGQLWRRYANDALAGPYAVLWDRLHALIYLAAPDMDAVLRWRTEQEQALPAGRRMSAAALARFIAHYERITRAMLTDLPQRAGLVVRLDAAHRVAEIRPNRPA
jgi:D-glycerate 3-kinase